jgi:hypothetical protein
MASQRSLIHKEKKRVPKIDPCGFPLRTDAYLHKSTCTKALEAPRMIRLNQGYSRIRKNIYSAQFQTEKRISSTKATKKPNRNQAGNDLVPEST